MIKSVGIFLSFIFIASSMAMEMTYLARSPRALLMGDAYTAIADDEYTLFYNPAALGRNKGVSFTPLDPTLGITDVYSDLDRFQNFPSSNAPAIAQRLMGFPVYLNASGFPTIKMAQFGMTLFLNNTSSMVLRNAVHPMMNIKYRYDRGFIMGGAYNIGTGALSSKGKKGTKNKPTTGQRLSIGFAVKHLNRQGLDGQFDLFGTTLLNKISSGAGDIAALKDALGYASGDAWGADLGVEYAQVSGRNHFTAGFSLMDIGSTRFTKTSGTADVPKQDMILNTGVAFKQDFGLFDYTLSADLHPLLGPVDFVRQFHLGAELSLPLISVMTGFSEGYISYGASVKVWPFKLTAGLYGVELGSKYKEEEGKRFVLYLSLFDFSIDL